MAECFVSLVNEISKDKDWLDFHECRRTFSRLPKDRGEQSDDDSTHMSSSVDPSLSASVEKPISDHREAVSNPLLSEQVAIESSAIHGKIPS